MAQLCRVGLVGRPNVGKSTLFNRLIGKRLAVVADQAGTTRDRLEEVVSDNGTQFVLFDMAGVETVLAEHSDLTKAVQEQVDRSLQEADILVWVVDSRSGANHADSQVSTLLRRLNKPVILAANKNDHQNHDITQYEFAQYGFEPLISLSAVHGRGVQELWSAITTEVKQWQENHQTEETDPEFAERELRLAIVGRPNVGKSTLLNRIVGANRSVVSSEANTTRDSVDTVLPAVEVFGKTYTRWRSIRLIDTAGIRRRGKIGHEIEAWSVVRTLDAVDRAEVVLFLIDSEEGLVHQDLQVVQQVVDSGRAMVLLVNKWDAVLAKKDIFAGTAEDDLEQQKLLDRLRQQAPFLHWIHVLFLSAKEGMNVHIIGRLVLKAYQSWNITIEQKELDELTAVLQRTPRLKNLQKITLEHSCPPVFHIHVEGKSLPHFSTNRYLENALRDTFEIGSTPIKIWSVPSVSKRRD